MMNPGGVAGHTSSLGLLADALARYESGLLVHGDQVTDLLTGFSLSTPPAAPQTRTGEHPTYRRSGLNLQELDDLAELVTQVMQQRQSSPFSAGLDSGIAMDHFPYGLNAKVPEVLVTGADAAPIAKYLRSAGFRARIVDTQYAMTLAGHLAMAQQDLRALAPHGVPLGAHGGAGPAERPGQATGPAVERRGGKTLALPWGASPVAAIFIVIIVVAGAMAAGLALDVAGNGATEVNAAENTSEDAPAQAEEELNQQPEAPPPFTPKPNRPEMQEPKINGKPRDERGSRRAHVPVAADWPEGWALIKATPEREVYQSEKDRGMRVLLAAKPAPLRNQRELDDAVLQALKDAPGTTVASEYPVSYREKYDDSETLWFVRLVEGHQVSVGCQYREPNPVRSRVCEQVVNSAKLEHE